MEGSYDSGHLSHPEYALMKKWYEFAADKFEKQVKPDLIGKYLIANNDQPIMVVKLYRCEL